MALKPVITWKHKILTLEVATNWLLLRLSHNNQLLARVNREDLDLFRAGLDRLCQKISFWHSLGTHSECDTFLAAGPTETAEVCGVSLSLDHTNRQTTLTIRGLSVDLSPEELSDLRYWLNLGTVAGPALSCDRSRLDVYGNYGRVTAFARNKADRQRLAEALLTSACSGVAGAVTIGATEVWFNPTVGSGFWLHISRGEKKIGHAPTTRSQLAHAALIISGESHQPTTR